MSAVVFANQKGGTGKTTLAVLFAFWLVEKLGQRVCVIDLDGQLNASKTLAKYDCGVAAAALFESTRIAVPNDGVEPLTLFAGSKAMGSLERGNPELLFPAFRQHVAALGQVFDSVVIDTPPFLGLRMSAALIAADHVACPIEMEEYSIDGVTDMLKTIFGVRQKYNPSLQLLGIVANRFNPHSVRQKEALHSLIEHYGEFVIPAKISTRSAIPEGLAAGVPVWRLAKSSAREASVEVTRMFELLRKKMGEGIVATAGAAHEA